MVALVRHRRRSALLTNEFLLDAGCASSTSQQPLGDEAHAHVLKVADAIPLDRIAGKEVVVQCLPARRICPETPLFVQSICFQKLRANLLDAQPTMSLLRVNECDDGTMQCRTHCYHSRFGAMEEYPVVWSVVSSACWYHNDDPAMLLMC